MVTPDGKNIDRDNPIVPDVNVPYSNADFERV